MDGGGAVRRWSLTTAAVLFALVPLAHLRAVAHPPLAVVLEGALPIGLLAGVAHVGRQYARAESAAFVGAVTGRMLATVAGVQVLNLWTMTVTVARGGDAADPAGVTGMYLAAGAVAGLYLGAADVRREQHERALAEERDRLDFLNDLLRHNVLNAMQVVIGRAERLRERPNRDDADAVLRWARTVARQVQRMRLLTGETERIRRIDLATVLRREASKAADREGVDVTAELPQRLVVVADEGVSALFETLFSNAVDHADLDPKIELWAETTADDVTVCLADDGPGLPAALSAALNAGEADADVFGFGLHLVATLARRYGGSLRVDENEPRGTVFRVTLPRAEDR
ncbi:sensor histidine kinase [Halegenticoccus tardaugens]|uniref:sensor histidine kinase n=1 Tax=Halegenticoccus tardaugens TaxID=2071624 RepID=UPI00100A30FD|nr:ATP-binding protein [Halegenticoccus tardaugens]